MKPKKIIKKTLYLLIPAAGSILLLILAVVLLMGLMKDSDYRTVLITELSGNASIERAGTKPIVAYENMYCRFGDVFDLSSESCLKLQMDNNRFLMMDAETKAILEASGSTESKAIKITLCNGMLINELQEASSCSSYDIVTENATISVNGAIVQVILQTNGTEQLLNIAVTDGEVNCRTYNSSAEYDTLNDLDCYTVQSGYGLLLRIQTDQDLNTVKFSASPYLLTAKTLLLSTAAKNYFLELSSLGKKCCLTTEELQSITPQNTINYSALYTLISAE